MTRDRRAGVSIQNPSLFNPSGWSWLPKKTFFDDYSRRRQSNRFHREWWERGDRGFRFLLCRSKRKKKKRKKAHLKEGGEGDEASLGSTLLPDSHSLNGGNVGGWKKRNKKLWTLYTRATIASPFHLSIFRGGVASRVSCVEGDTESTAPLSRFRFPIPRVELRRKDYGFSRPFTRPRSIRNSNLFLRWDERISLRLQANQLDDKWNYCFEVSFFLMWFDFRD